MSTPPSPVAFIGMGVMGRPMAGHLLSAGHPLVVYTRTREKAQQIGGLGAKIAASPAEAVAKAEFVLICVTDTPDVEKVICGEKGILETVKAGQIVVDHSTISPAATRVLHAKLLEKGVELLDAPVSGGEIGAKNATLSIMVGGNRAAFDKTEPLLRHMGKVITYCGPTGAGQMTKLVNQILVSVTCLAVSEALVFAQKNGLDVEKTMAALGGGAGASWQLANMGPKMVKGDLRPGFTVQLQQKDLRLVLRAAEETNTSMPATSLVHQLYTAAQAAGHERDGTQSLFTVLQKLASLH